MTPDIDQAREDDAALERRLEIWCDANPDANVTPAELREMASGEAA